MPINPLLAAGALSSIGSLGSKHDAYRQQVEERHNAISRYRRGMADFGLGMDRAQGAFEGVISGLNKSFGLARADLSSYGNAARRNVTTGGKQALASTLSSLTSRGLGSSTVLDNARTGISTQTSRALADVDEKLGAMFASLRTQEGGAVASAQGNLANFLGQRATQEFSNRQGLINLYLGTMAQKPDPYAAIGSAFNALGAGMQNQQLLDILSSKKS